MRTRTAPTILAIDDNADITRLLRGVLRQQGYRVIVSNEPTLCLELMEREKPDLVLVDLCMPGMDGWEVCQAIRRTSSVPILVLTVLAEKHYVERTLAAGADAHMSKPFSITDLLEKVQGLLRLGVHREDACLSEAEQVQDVKK